MSKQLQPVVLAIIDGWGVAPDWGGNAISIANLPTYNSLIKTYPNTLLQASGVGVGLPPGERGNSEVGHLNIGCGQVVHESLTSISESISDNSFFANPTLIEAIDHAKQSGKALHVIGLVSDGGIHSHINHLFALIDMAKLRGLPDMFLHAITDGRDTPPFVAQRYLSQVAEKFRSVGFGHICTVSGRYYAMDRDRRWDRVEKFYRAITEGVGLAARTPEAAIAASYRDGVSDEFVLPTVIVGEGNNFQPIRDGDTIFCINFRADRARELTQALIKPEFSGFKRKVELKDIQFVGFTFFQEGLPMKVAFRPRDVNFPLSRVLSDAGLSHLHVAESEKYAHVTYFFNGGVEKPFAHEERIVVPSPQVASYDQTPEMSTMAIAKEVAKNLGKYNFTVCNFAAPDMIGHTGNLKATITACEATDEGLKTIYDAVIKQEGVLLITSDHGNAEELVDRKTGEPDTEHNNSPVPFILIGEAVKTRQLRREGILADIAPTVLELLGIKQPSEMTGKSLLMPVSQPAK